MFVIVPIRGCCFSQSSLDTASSIDKSVPLEMPNQRSAIAQAQGLYCILYSHFTFYSFTHKIKT